MSKKEQSQRRDIIRIDEIPEGPRIQGQVSVNLADLDRMRADHAAAIKLATELQAQQKTVTIYVKEHFVGYHEETDYRGRRASYPHNDYRTIQTEYKGFDDVKEELKLEVAKEYRDIAKKLQDRNRELGELNLELDNKLKTTETGLAAFKVELTKADTDKAKLQKQIEDLTVELSGVKNINDGINKRLKEVSENLKAEQHRKGFWGFLK